MYAVASQETLYVVWLAGMDVGNMVTRAQISCYRCRAWPCECRDGQTIIHGDCLDTLPLLDAESVHCCVTSPPYWGLRDYGTATWEGGDSQCDHIQSQQPQSLAALADKHAPRVNPRNPNRQDDESINARQYRDVCGKCGAQRVDVQIGLEATPDEYVAKMVEVFREVRRVLQKDATCWIVLGDSYSTAASGLPHKNLVGIPWRVALALQADGWYLRQDIIWHKPNPMPESVTDRCTKSHEYVFLLTKAARYYYDAESIAEVCVCTRKPGQRVNTTEHYGPTNGGNAGDRKSVV